MASPFTDRTLWLRLALIMSIVWVGGTIIVSQARSDFRWFPYTYRNDYTLGPAGVTAIVGVFVIFAVCVGVPWIAERAEKSVD